MRTLIGDVRRRRPSGEIFRLTQGLGEEVACFYNFVRELPVRFRKQDKPAPLFRILRDENVCEGNVVRRRNESAAKMSLPQIGLGIDLDQKYKTIASHIAGGEDCRGPAKTILRSAKQLIPFGKDTRITFQALLETPLKGNAARASDRQSAYKNSICIMPLRMNRSLSRNNLQTLKASKKVATRTKQVFPLQKTSSRKPQPSPTAEEARPDSTPGQRQSKDFAGKSIGGRNNDIDTNCPIPDSRDNIIFEGALLQWAALNPAMQPPGLNLTPQRGPDSFYNSKWIQLIDELNRQPSLDAMEQIGYYKEQKCPKHLSFMQQPEKGDKKTGSHPQTGTIDMVTGLLARLGTDIHLSETFIRKMNDLTEKI